MKKTFVIISVSDRVEDLNGLLASIRSFHKFDDFSISVLYQDYLGNSEKIYDHFINNLYIYPEKMGCHGARVQLLRHLEKFDYDIFVNLDDDMELTRYTDYFLPIRKIASEPGTGFILTNWAKTYDLLMAKVPKMRDEFKKQTLVYNGGGMVYGKRVASLMSKLPIVKTAFDNAWAMTAYVNGYTNYRFMGSLAVHRVCGRGGMQLFMAENPADLMCEDLIDFKRSKKQRGNGFDYLIPLDADINQKAHCLHNLNKKR